jgi:hypothetical protein
MIPETTLQLARDILVLQDRARAEHATLLEASTLSTGAESVGKAALAEEMQQVSKVLANYMPRIMKHVGDIPFVSEPEPVDIPEFLQTVPDELTDLVRENEPYGESQARLWQLYVNLQSRIADNGLSMDLPTPDQYALHSRLSRHLEWLRGTGAVDVI